MSDIKQKQWWTPVWKGLVLDPDAKHYRRMKNAVWLYVYLLLNADRKNGCLLRKTDTIARDTGIKKDTVMRWLSVLRTGGYIATTSNGRSLSVQILRWKVREVGKIQFQKPEISDTRYGKYPNSPRAPNLEFKAYPSQRSGARGSPNDISIKRYLLKFDNDNQLKGTDKFMNFIPDDENDLLATDLAQTLNDLPSLLLYIAYSRKYPHGLLRKVLGEVMEVPINKIKKSRGALFNHLVQKYAKHNNQNPGD